MGRCLQLGAVLAVVAAGAWYFAVHHSPLSGTFPLLHVGVPWGYTGDQIPDLRGKVAVVTGANVGLGRGIAQHLIQHGAHVHITCRSADKCRRATAEIAAAKPEGGAGIVSCSVLELSSLNSVKNWLQEMTPKLREMGGIDMLILNAGVMACPYALTEDGIEWQFGVNHVGHFAMARGALPLVEQAAARTGDARVVVVSSLAHMAAPSVGIHPTLAELNNPAHYSEQAGYGQSKLANILFTKELQKRVDQKGQKIYVNVIHPGGVQSNLMHHIRTRIAGVLGEKAALAVEAVMQSIYWTEYDGALTAVYPATSPEIAQKGIRGQYFVPIARLAEPSEHARNATLAASLWQLTEQILAEKGF